MGYMEDGAGSSPVLETESFWQNGWPSEIPRKYPDVFIVIHLLGHGGEYLEKIVDSKQGLVNSFILDVQKWSFLP